ncbi:hypothetical protein Lesp02_66280 [Lentzea sp. NBRC 105346]|uniref:hypothetical protein n=1 Tax=Lentzea sp. NBRC 105346 TaxID=3032205 RepID=UPI0024A05220|nr:hypothetical protein [Lentzea sp. NBRC 105346]GLZ34441.1 hypothetical protein Lesp02_66280 [Lentzea sp. NBRC 105346]
MRRIGGGYGSALGFGCGVAVTVATGMWPVLALILLVAVVLVVSLHTTIVGAVLAALQCWGLYATFLVGPAGELTFSAEMRWLLAIMVQLAVLATLASAAVRVMSVVLAVQPTPVRP